MNDIPDTAGWTLQNYYSYNLPAIQALIEGKKLQYVQPGNNKWIPFTADGCPAFWCTPFRPAPEPTYQPWTFANAPRGGFFRLKGHQTVYAIAAIYLDGLRLTSYEVLSFKELLVKYEYSSHGYDNWGPCGSRASE